MSATRAAPAMAEAYSRLAQSLGPIQVVIELPKTAYVPLKSSKTDAAGSKSSEWQAQLQQTKSKSKSFQLNIGGLLTIPSADAKAKPQYTPAQSPADAAIRDPFEGLPFRAFAERMGERILPAVEAARDQQRQAVRDGRVHAENAQPVVPYVPHVLPFTRWAAANESFRQTLVVDDPATRKKARLSWYHPDDTMVPRDWFTGGLLADLKYYMPFGFFGAQAEAPSSSA